MTPAERTVRADALLSHLRSGWYVYRYRVCQCGHGEAAHGPMGCEGRTDEGEHCECRREASGVSGWMRVAGREAVRS